MLSVHTDPDPVIAEFPGSLRRFLDRMSEHRLFAFYRLAAYSGARRGEPLNLRWLDVDGRLRLSGLCCGKLREPEAGSSSCEQRG